MNIKSEANLSPSFIQQLIDDRFEKVGHYEIDKSYACKIVIYKEAEDWQFCVYTHVSYADGGKHIRIGKSELPLRDRMRSWQRLVEQALKLTMSENRQFSGATPPWEAQGWVDYTVPYQGCGLLFAQRVEGRSTIEETKMALRRLEKRLQDRYDPPLCNDTVAGR